MRVDVEKFEEYTRNTLILYLDLYAWFYMPASVHKILFYGANIIKSFGLIPIGILSEKAQESRSKDFKRYREFNTRKCSRIYTNTDLLHKLLVSSDPYVSSLRQKPATTKLEIDLEATNLLILSGS